VDEGIVPLHPQTSWTCNCHCVPGCITHQQNITPHVPAEGYGRNELAKFSPRRLVCRAAPTISAPSTGSDWSACAYRRRVVDSAKNAKSSFDKTALWTSLKNTAQPAAYRKYGRKFQNRYADHIVLIDTAEGFFRTSHNTMIKSVFEWKTDSN
jgi:hypothetical protein